jgi:hypothetical protein
MHKGKPKSNQCVAEEFVSDIPYRMFFDIEPKKGVEKETVPIDKIKQTITTIMSRITRTHAGSDFKIVQCIQDS